MADVVRDRDGVTVYDARWPRCYSCGQQTPDVRALRYRRHDGVPGMSYPDCADCRNENAQRLKALGFHVLGAPGRTDTNREKGNA